MNIRDLEAFVAVVETGSVVAASTRLHLTQPGVTRRVQNLEEALEAQLLERPSKPLKPTDAGRQVYTLGRQVLRSVDELKSALAPGDELRGELRLGLSPFVAETALRAPIDALHLAFPALQLQISSAWSPDLVERLRRGELDAAAVYLPAEEKLPAGLRADVVGEQPAVVVAALHAPFSGRVRLKQLQNIPWVLNQYGCGFRSMIRGQFVRAGLSLEVAVETMDPELQLSLVARGAGLGLVAQRTLLASRWRDRVQVLALPELKLSVSISIVHRPPAGRLVAPIERLREALTDAYA